MPCKPVSFTLNILLNKNAHRVAAVQALKNKNRCCKRCIYLSFPFFFLCVCRSKNRPTECVGANFSGLFMALNLHDFVTISDLAKNIEKKRTDKCHHRYARLSSLNVFSGTILRIFFSLSIFIFEGFSNSFHM